jgi:hypothetical protein
VDFLVGTSDKSNSKSSCAGAQLSPHILNLGKRSILSAYLIEYAPKMAFLENEGIFEISIYYSVFKK